MRGGRRAFFSIFVLLIHQQLMLDARQLDGFIAGLFEEVLKFRTIKIVENSFFFCSIPLTVQWILHNCIHRSIITCSRSHCCVYSELWSTWHFCINKIWSHLNLFLGRGFAPLLSDRFIKMLLHKYLNSLAPKSLSHVFPFSAIILYWHILYLIRLSITEIKFNSSNWFS